MRYYGRRYSRDTPQRSKMLLEKRTHKKHLFFRDIIRLQVRFWEWFCSLQILNAIPKTFTNHGIKDA